MSVWDVLHGLTSTADFQILYLSVCRTVAHQQVQLYVFRHMWTKLVVAKRLVLKIADCWKSLWCLINSSQLQSCVVAEVFCFYLLQLKMFVLNNKKLWLTCFMQKSFPVWEKVFFPQGGRKVQCTLPLTENSMFCAPCQIILKNTSPSTGH